MGSDRRSENRLELSMLYTIYVYTEISRVVNYIYSKIHAEAVLTWPRYVAAVVVFNCNRQLGYLESLLPVMIDISNYAITFADLIRLSTCNSVDEL